MALKNRPAPKYFTIKQQLISRIKDGTYLPGAKLPSIRQMSRDFDVSFMTSHRILEAIIDDGYAVSVQGSGTTVLDTEHSKAPLRRLAFQPSNEIVLNIPGPMDEFYSSFLNSISRTLADKKFFLNLAVHCPLLVFKRRDNVRG